MTDRPGDPHSKADAAAESLDESLAESLARRVGQRLQESAADLDAATASRLNRARQAALAELDPSRSPGPWRWPAAAAAAGLLALAFLLVRLGPETPAPGAAVPEPADLDLALAAGDDGLELMQDLDFYTWLDPGLTAEELAAALEADDDA